MVERRGSGGAGGVLVMYCAKKVLAVELFDDRWFYPVTNNYYYRSHH